MQTRFGYSLLLASAAVVGLASSAYSFTLTDDPSVSAANTIYYGANNTYNGQDIIGNSPPFSIFSAVVTRTGLNNNTLDIRINTNFAGAPGTGPADGTGYGSLFLNPVFWSANPASAATHYSADNFVAGNQNWAYAVTTPSTGSGPSGLYNTGLNPTGPSGVSGEVDSHGVPLSYTNSNGTIYMSNVNNNPLSAPASGNPGFYFRQGQAVLFSPTEATVLGTSVTVTTVAGSYIEYLINDTNAHILGNTFALSWAMTCANDVIQGLVTLPSTDLRGSTPLPAALPLFAGGLGVIGLLARRKQRKAATATVVA